MKTRLCALMLLFVCTSLIAAAADNIPERPGGFLMPTPTAADQKVTFVLFFMCGGVLFVGFGWAFSPTPPQKEGLVFSIILYTIGSALIIPAAMVLFGLYPAGMFQ